jgi:hypothetical protein
MRRVSDFQVSSVAREDDPIGRRPDWNFVSGIRPSGLDVVNGSEIRSTENVGRLWGQPDGKSVYRESWLTRVGKRRTIAA